MSLNAATKRPTQGTRRRCPNRLAFTGCFLGGPGRQQCKSNRRHLRIGAWRRERMPLGATVLATQRIVAGNGFACRAFRGRVRQLWGRQSSPLRTVARSSDWCHSPEAVVSTPRGVLNNDVTRCAPREHWLQVDASNSCPPGLATKVCASTCSCELR